jgi:3,4-dihydroxy 2-butanone 4-phosphate synthase/GTP cyclohydrolase II
METDSTDRAARDRVVRGLPDLNALLSDAAEFRSRQGRPFVVLSYAQSVDGSIAGRRRERIRLSGAESLHLTHSIRAICDVILVGIGTILADDPRLTVKQVDGPHPHPVVLDTRLRTPEAARLLQRPGVRPWLIHAPAASPERIRRLSRSGADPLPCSVAADGRIDLPALMETLADRAVNSVMVEGGARVITSFLRQRLADAVIVTISPQLLGGLPVIDPDESDRTLDLHLDHPFYQTLGRDLVIWSRPRWPAA